MDVFLNGSIVDRADARVPVDDRGFLFGDGVYEVMRLTSGRLFEPERHLRRLAPTPIPSASSRSPTTCSGATGSPRRTRWCTCR